MGKMVDTTPAKHKHISIVSTSAAPIQNGPVQSG